MHAIFKYKNTLYKYGNQFKGILREQSIVIQLKLIK